MNYRQKRFKTGADSPLNYMKAALTRKIQYFKYIFRIKTDLCVMWVIKTLSKYIISSQTGNGSPIKSDLTETTFDRRMGKTFSFWITKTCIGKPYEFQL